MATFLHHTSCSKCNSRDNLAVYSDGSTWCFGCGVSSKAKHVDVEYAEPKKFWYPKDLTKTLNPKNKAWLKGYDLSLSELDLFSYSPSLDRHVYSVYSNGEVIMWEGRSMHSKPKTLCVGPKPIHVLNPGRTTLVVCEDIISALKISRHTSCMPLFGSKLRLDHLAQLSKEYKTIKVWLDSDKFDEAMNITCQASNLGMDAQVIFTHRDAKDYGDNLIERKVR